MVRISASVHLTCKYDAIWVDRHEMASFSIQCIAFIGCNDNWWKLLIMKCSGCYVGYFGGTVFMQVFPKLNRMKSRNWCCSRSAVAAVGRDCLLRGRTRCERRSRGHHLLRPITALWGDAKYIEWLRRKSESILTSILICTPTYNAFDNITAFRSATASAKPLTGNDVNDVIGLICATWEIFIMEVLHTFCVYDFVIN